MITRIVGKLIECDLTEVVVDVHGIGFAISVPMSTYDVLPQPESEVSLHTHFHVREDSMQLFGFATLQERELFRLLISVSGIGPRLALNVLSCMSVENFCRTIAAADAKALSRVNGIGKRSSERLIVELKERVDEIAPGADLDAGDTGEAATSRDVQDAVSALETLGFKATSARKAVERIRRDLPREQCSAENLIRKALAALNS